jgi:ssDNA-binding Zn-finger/Zn-ribbon topoisomerase 1
MDIQEAWTLFMHYYDGRWDGGPALNQLPTDEAVVQTLYRMFVAPKTHPDNGGTSEKFRQGQLAREALLNHIRGPQKPEITRYNRTCPSCDGEGTLTLKSGRWGGQGLTKRCPACNGSGLL